MKRKNVISLFVVVAIASILIGCLLPGTRWTTVDRAICPACGAQRWQTDRVFGKESGPHVTPAPLTTWLTEHGIAHQHTWWHQGSTGYDIFGRPMSIACREDIPPIALVPQDTLVEFLKAGTEADVQEFVQMTMSGSWEEQRRAIEKNQLQ